MPSDYAAQTWADQPSTSTPLDAARLNHIETGIAGHLHPFSDMPTSNATTISLTTGTPVTSLTDQEGDLKFDDATGIFYKFTSGAWVQIGSVRQDAFDQPSDFGLIGWTLDPAYGANNVGIVLGSVYLVKFRAVKTGTINNADYWVGTAGASLTSGQCLIGVYDNGQTTPNVLTRIGQSVDQSTNGVGTTNKVAAMAAGFAVQGGQAYWAAQVWNGTTAPQLTGTARIVQAGVSAMNLRSAIGATGQTSLPATIAAASLTATNLAATLGFR